VVIAQALVIYQLCSLATAGAGTLDRATVGRNPVRTHHLTLVGANLCFDAVTVTSHLEVEMAVVQSDYEMAPTAIVVVAGDSCSCAVSFLAAVPLQVVLSDGAS